MMGWIIKLLGLAGGKVGGFLAIGLAAAAIGGWGWACVEGNWKVQYRQQASINAANLAGCNAARFLTLQQLIAMEARNVKAQKDRDAIDRLKLGDLPGEFGIGVRPDGDKGGHGRK